MPDFVDEFCAGGGGLVGCGIYGRGVCFGGWDMLGIGKVWERDDVLGHDGADLRDQVFAVGAVGGEEGWVEVAEALDAIDCGEGDLG